MYSKIAPTDIISAELIFKDYVDFEENVIYLTDEVPDYIAKFLDDIMPDYVIIICEMFNPVCPYCGAKLHKHEIKKWDINKQQQYTSKDINAQTVHAQKQ